MTIQFREFHPDDVDAIFRIEKACYSSESQLPYYKLLEILGHSDVVAYVAEEKKSIIGCFIVKLEKFNNILLLLSLIVSPNHRKRGIASQAIHTIFAFAEHLNIRQISTQVEEKNQEGIRFLSSYGFEPQQKLNDFLFSGNVGLEMLKKS